MIKSFLTGYYKWALPISTLIILAEEIIVKDSALNKLARKTILDIGESAENFILAAGGVPNRDPNNKVQMLRGRDYYDSLYLPIYEEVVGRNLTLKQFMIEHVTHYQPGLFAGLARDWAAFGKWDISKPDGI
jgi:hypothetical protein